MIKKLVHKLFSLKKFIYWKVLSTACISGEPQRSTCVLCAGEGKIHFGKHVILGCPSVGYYNTCCHLEARNKNSFISIGDGSVLNNNAALISVSPGGECGISIGSRCLIGRNFTCFNTDFHSVAPDERDTYSAKSVYIGDNVFIGANVMILKGVVLGKDCTVGAGSVVTKSFPAGSIIAGNPARLIRTLPSYIKDEQNHDC